AVFERSGGAVSASTAGAEESNATSIARTAVLVECIRLGPQAGPLVQLIDCIFFRAGSLGAIALLARQLAKGPIAGSRRQSSGRTGCAGWWPKKPHGTGDLGPGHVGDEKAPAIDGRGKLAERLEVEFGPFRSASRMAECFLVALPPVLGSSAPKFAPFDPSPTTAPAYPGADSFLQSFFGRLAGCTE